VTEEWQLSVSRSQRREIDRHRLAEVVAWMPNEASLHGEHRLTGAIVTAACLEARRRPRRILYAFESYKVGYSSSRAVAAAGLAGSGPPPEEPVRIAGLP
jgi:hypothetical protein